MILSKKDSFDYVKKEYDSIISCVNKVTNLSKPFLVSSGKVKDTKDIVMEYFSIIGTEHKLIYMFNSKKRTYIINQCQSLRNNMALNLIYVNILTDSIDNKREALSLYKSLFNEILSRINVMVIEVNNDDTLNSLLELRDNVVFHISDITKKVHTFQVMYKLLREMWICINFIDDPLMKERVDKAYYNICNSEWNG